jgi:hypothetical protein
MRSQTLATARRLKPIEFMEVHVVTVRHPAQPAQMA